MCEECDQEAVQRLRIALWEATFAELMDGMHPADVLSSLALLIASVVAGGDPRVFNEFENHRGEKGRDAALRALFPFIWKNYQELKEVADGIREQLRTGGFVFDAGGPGPERDAGGADGSGSADSGPGRGDRPTARVAAADAGAPRRDGGATPREDSSGVQADAVARAVRRWTIH